MCVFLLTHNVDNRAEVTKNGVLASTAHRVKASIRADTMQPTIALVDPQVFTHHAEENKV